MKTAGIIAEYNPFHSGHQFHLAQTHRLSDAVIVLMSGSFVQRGEPAVFSKWQRAKAAVRGGADLVLELPTYYATASSADFALGAVRLFNALGIVDCLSFGSESGDLPSLMTFAEATLNETPAFSRALRTFLKEGLSYPSANEKALAACGLIMPQGANDLLACEYLRAIRLIGAPFTPLCIKRSNEHDDLSEKNDVLSAAAIRQRLREGKDVSKYMPEPCDETPLFFEDIAPMLFYRLLNFQAENYPLRSSADRELLSTICRTLPGNDTDTYLHNIKTKRYTMSRVKRTLLHILLNSGEAIPAFQPYARVLAMNDIGCSLLRHIKKISDIPVITKISKRYASENVSLALDIRATDIRALAGHGIVGLDFLTSPAKL